MAYLARDRDWVTLMAWQPRLRSVPMSAQRNSPHDTLAVGAASANGVHPLVRPASPEWVAVGERGPGRRLADAHGPLAVRRPAVVGRAHSLRAPTKIASRGWPYRAACLGEPRHAQAPGRVG